MKTFRSQAGICVVDLDHEDKCACCKQPMSFEHDKHVMIVTGVHMVRPEGEPTVAEDNVVSSQSICMGCFEKSKDFLSRMIAFPYQTEVEPTEVFNPWQSEVA